MSSNSRSTSASAMKQVKLNFASSKRTASASGAKKVVVNPAKRTTIQVSSPEESGRAAEISSDSPKDEEEELEKSSIALLKDQTLQDSNNNKKPAPEELPELNIRDPRWRKLFTDAKAKRGGLPLVHGKDENSVHQILRVFDLNYDYGPCIGVTRLERWERANALGLNPPIEIRDMLQTREGAEQKSYSECVFYDEV